VSGLRAIKPRNPGSVPNRGKTFSLLHRVQTRRLNQQISRASSPGVKRTENESYHSLSSSAEVKNAWSLPNSQIRI
jgi:hypothetical protein